MPSSRRLLGACALISAVLGGCRFAQSHCSCTSCQVMPCETIVEDCDVSWSGGSLEPPSGDSAQAKQHAQQVTGQDGRTHGSEQKMPTGSPNGIEVIVADDVPAFPRGEQQSPRKAFTDITAHASFGHAPDYTWISGEVQKWRHEWRLRYASVDEVDPYGGSVTLAGDHYLDQLKEGDQVKLVGHIATNDSKTAGAVFCIDNVQPVGR